MFKTLLVPTDGSPLSDMAVNGAVNFARQTGASIVGITVVEPYPFAPISDSAYAGGSEAYRQREHENAQYRLSKLRTAATAGGVPCKTLVAESTAPHEEIVEAANRLGCDMIFMASHGRKGLSRLIVGSVTQKVLAQAGVPVMVYR